MKHVSLFVAVLLSVLSVGHATSHTNIITTPGGVSAYSVDGSDPVNPTINWDGGVTNVLKIDVSGSHPVVVTTDIDVSAWFAGADSQVVVNGDINVSTSDPGAPTVLYYMCYVHGFFGEIDIAAPPSPVPPQNIIYSIQVGTNVVMISSGTNTDWGLVPEFSSNLLQGAWTPVPSFSTSYANGTNVTTFNRLDPICGPNVFLRLKQEQP